MSDREIMECGHEKRDFVSICSLCEIGFDVHYGKVKPRKLVDIRGDIRWRHEHEADMMFFSECANQGDAMPYCKSCKLVREAVADERTRVNGILETGFRDNWVVEDILNAIGGSNE